MNRKEFIQAIINNKIPNVEVIGIPTKKHRPIAAIASDIRKAWKKPYFGAVPYLQAMLSLNDITDNYGLDEAESIIRYFLSNAASFRGSEARQLKEELKGMLR